MPLLVFVLMVMWLSNHQQHVNCFYYFFTHCWLLVIANAALFTAQISTRSKNTCFPTAALKINDFSHYPHPMGWGGTYWGGVPHPIGYPPPTLKVSWLSFYPNLPTCGGGAPHPYTQTYPPLKVSWLRFVGKPGNLWGWGTPP